MYIVCPNCKQIKIEWPDNDNPFTSMVVRTQEQIGLPCQECFAERKIMPGRAPQTCRHGRPLDIKCRDCQKEDNEQYNAY